jgi:hypothetical protein
MKARRADTPIHGAPERAQQKTPGNQVGEARFRRGLKAERSGFEPEMPVARHTGLAIRRFRPLSHLSGI